MGIPVAPVTNIRYALAERLPTSATLKWIYSLSTVQTVHWKYHASHQPTTKQLSFSTAWYLSSTEICVTVLRKYVVLQINALTQHTPSYCTMPDSVTVPLFVFLYLFWWIRYYCLHLLAELPLTLPSAFRIYMGTWCGNTRYTHTRIPGLVLLNNGYKATC